MPGSRKYGKQNIKEWIGKQKGIERIIDVGAGGCTYPKLLGDKYRYTAIEIWPPYIEQFGYDKYYDEIIVADVQYVRWPDGDLAILGDVIEHLVKGNALNVLYRVLGHYPHVVLSIPLGDTPGKDHYGNWFERHHSTWEFEEIEKLTDWDIAIHLGKKTMGVFAK